LAETEAEEANETEQELAVDDAPAAGEDETEGESGDKEGGA
jgi:hypothetical protein